MKKAIGSLLLLLIVLVGCSGESASEVDADETKDVENIKSDTGDVDDETDVETEEVERSPLPFDVDDFYEEYYSSIGERFNLEEATPIATQEWTITLLNGSMDESLIFLTVLSEIVDSNKIEELAEGFALDLLEDGYYINDLNSDGLAININAIDTDSVSIAVLSE